MASTAQGNVVWEPTDELHPFKKITGFDLGLTTDSTVLFSGIRKNSIFRLKPMMAKVLSSLEKQHGRCLFPNPPLSLTDDYSYR